MSAEFKINSNLFTSLNEIITDPFMLMDNVGNVLSFNKEAGLLFLFDNNKNNIYDKFDDPSAELINKLIEKLLLNKGPLVKLVNLKLKSGLELSGEVQLNIFYEHKENFVLFSFKKRELNNPLSLSEISIQNELKDIINNNEILKAVEDVRINFPFSLIGKESFRKNIDKLEEPFWIEDGKGNYIIVNSSLSRETGIKIQQMEGKSVSNFLLPVLSSLYESINNYIKDSNNSIVIKGVPFKGMGNSNLYETIKYPLFDSAHNYILSIGITQKIVIANEDFKVILNNYPNAAAFINTKDEINGMNDSFALLLNKEPDNIINKNFKDVFPGDFVTQLKQFQMGNKIELKLPFS
jgi:PAS domain-containing protein